MHERSPAGKESDWSGRAGQRARASAAGTAPQLLSEGRDSRNHATRARGAGTSGPLRFLPHPEGGDRTEVQPVPLSVAEVISKASVVDLQLIAADNSSLLGNGADMIQVGPSPMLGSSKDLHRGAQGSAQSFCGLSPNDPESKDEGESGPGMPSLS